MDDLTNTSYLRFWRLVLSFLAILPCIARYRAGYVDFTLYSFITCLVLSGSLALNLYPIFLWAAMIRHDLNGRADRAKFMTHLLDPNKKAWHGKMCNSYKMVLFGSIKFFNKEQLKNNKFENIDIYNASAIYSWVLLKIFFDDIGLQFLRRVSGNLGLLLLFCGFYLFLVILTEIRWKLTVLFEDALVALIVSCIVFYNVFYAVSAGRTVNGETVKQRILLSEFICQHMIDEFRLVDRGQEIWAAEVRESRQMMEHGLELLNQEHRRNIRIWNIEVDDSTVQILVTIFGVLVYFLIYFTVQSITVREKDSKFFWSQRV